MSVTQTQLAIVTKNGTVIKTIDNPTKKQTEVALSKNLKNNYFYNSNGEKEKATYAILIQDGSVNDFQKIDIVNPENIEVVRMIDTDEVEYKAEREEFCNYLS